MKPRLFSIAAGHPGLAQMPNGRSHFLPVIPEEASVLTAAAGNTVRCRRVSEWLAGPAWLVQTSSTSAPPPAAAPRAAACRCSRACRRFSQITFSAGTSSARVTAWLLPAAGSS